MGSDSPRRDRPRRQGRVSVADAVAVPAGSVPTLLGIMGELLGFQISDPLVTNGLPVYNIGRSIPVAIDHLTEAVHGHGRASAGKFASESVGDARNLR